MDRIKMNLYKLVNKDDWGYDMYDSCIVVAKNEEDAIKIHPSGLNLDRDVWTRNPDKISCTLIGRAVKGLKEGNIVIASFNAG